MTPDMTLALPPLPCRHCDTVAVPTLGPGAGQHVARAVQRVWRARCAAGVAPSSSGCHGRSSKERTVWDVSIG